MTLPPLPPWEGAHVLIVHFPVALLLAAPLFMLLALFLPRLPGFALAAWVLLLLGTVAAWVAAASGHAAFEDTGEMPAAAHDLMLHHGAMGVQVRNTFTAICIAYALVLLVPRIFKRIKLLPWRIVGTLIVLAVCGWAALLLANTAHAGGTLVHQYGVRANLGLPQTAPATTQN